MSDLRAAGAAPHVDASVVASVVARDAAELRVRALAAAADADLVELRLDGVDLGPPGAARDRLLADLVRAVPRPVIAAAPPRAGDSGEGDPAARHALLAAAARAGASYVDLDATLAAREVEHRLLPRGTRRVLSVHADGPSVSHAALDALAAPLARAAVPGDVVKVVPRAERAEDALATLAWLARRSASAAPGVAWTAFVTSARAPLVSLASRLLAPSHGGALVYAAPDDGGAVAAPGQPRVSALRAAWPPAGVPAARLLGIVGRPLGHSASPRVHAAAQRALGLEALFVPLEADGLADVLAALTDARWHGLSVTAPFKAEALALAASADDDARAIGAANTLVRRSDGRWHAANTDAPAVLAALGGADAVRGRRALVVGAGGAARAAAHALAGAGAAVTVAARDARAAGALAAEVQGAALDLAALAALADADPIPHAGGAAGGAAPSRGFPVVVHATPLGTEGRGEAPVPRALLGPGVAVLDAVYRPRRTGLLRRAAAEGATGVSGEAWFLAQAEAQLARWHRLAPPLPAAAGAAMAEALADGGGPPSDLVVLLGLRCAGKSTLARGLAAALGGSAVDLDVEVARRFVPRGPEEAHLAGRPAGELLAALGEARFRAEEADALASVLAPMPAPVLAPVHAGRAAARGPRILATGGGVVESPSARDRLAALAGRAVLVWLDAPPAVLAARLAASSDLRPPLTAAPSPRDELELLHRRRAPLYRALADVVIDTTAPPEEVLRAALARVAASATEAPPRAPAPPR